MADDPAVIAAIDALRQSVDNVHTRLDSMVTRAELTAEMRQVNGRLDRVQASVETERTERVEHVRAERQNRRDEAARQLSDFMAAIAKERTDRLDAEDYARQRVWKTLGVAIPSSSVLVAIIALIIDHI